MRILVDHGTHANLGDLAMVESVVARLRRVLPAADLAVVDRTRLASPVWQVPGVSRQPPYRVAVWGDRVVSTLPWFWRHAGAWRLHAGRAMLALHQGALAAGACRLTLPADGTRLRDYCAPFDGLHVVGGGNLSDAFFPELFNRTCLVRAFTALGKPVVLTGQQLGPFTSRWSRRALGAALREAACVGLRDGGDSLAVCRDAGLDPARVVVMGDDALGLPAADPEAGAAMARALGVEPGAFIAVNLRRGTYGAGAASVTRFADVLRALHAITTLPYVVLPISLGDADNDLASGLALADALRDVPVRLPGADGLTPGSVRALAAVAHGAVGVSHHFCLFALTAAVPAVCVHDGPYYAQKARALASFWGDGRLAAPLHGEPASDAAARLAGAFEDDGLRAHLAARAAAARTVWVEAFDARVRAAFRPGNGQA